MVKANELKIGNWIEFAAFGYYQIAAIGKTWVALDGTGEPVIHFRHDIELNEDVAPIPLTTGILERCGFGQSEVIEVFSKINGRKDEEGKTIVYEKHYSGNTIKVEYLHQLQNLVYSLTGEELTFQKDNALVMNK
jgi:hypothetical protein